MKRRFCVLMWHNRFKSPLWKSKSRNLKGMSWSNNSYKAWGRKISLLLQYTSLYYLNLFWAFSTSLIPWWMQKWEHQMKVISDRDSLYLKIFYILSMISDRMNKRMTWKLFIDSSLTETACIYKYLASFLSWNINMNGKQELDTKYLEIN